MSIIIELFIFVYLAVIVLLLILSTIWFIPVLFDFVLAMRKAFSGRLHRHSNNWAGVFAKLLMLPYFVAHPVALTLIYENQKTALKWREFNCRRNSTVRNMRPLR